MVGLRSHHHVDSFLARDDFLALRLPDATRDGDQHRAASPHPAVLQLLQAPELGIHFLGGFLADVARVQNHQVGILGAVARHIADRRQQIRHARGIVDVHLATESLDEQLLHLCASLRFAGYE
jgi:hypothetical protein